MENERCRETTSMTLELNFYRALYLDSKAFLARNLLKASYSITKFPTAWSFFFPPLACLLASAVAQFQMHAALQTNIFELA